MPDNETDRSTSRSDGLRVLARLALSLAIGAALVLVFTAPFGIGLSSDSAHYLGCARSIASGRGLAFNGAPFVHWPPLYPALLAAMMQFGLPGAEAAKLLAAALFGLNAYLFSRLSLLCLPAGYRRTSTFLLFLFVLFFSPELLHVHLMAWSEPLMLLFTLVLLSGLERWWQTGRYGWLCLVSCSLAAGMLTRFVGVALLVPTLACVLARPLNGFGRKIGLCLTVLVSVVPLVGFVLWSRSTHAGASDRTVAWHPPGGSKGEFALVLLSVCVAASLIGLVLARGIGRSTESDKTAMPVPLWCSLFLGAYLGLILISLCLADALTPLDWRILQPVSCIVLSPFLWRLLPLQGRRIVVGQLVLLFCIAALRVPIAISILRTRYTVGYAYSGVVWRNSASVALIRRLPPGVLIFSNSPEAIFVCAGRESALLPASVSPTSLRRDRRYLAGMLRLREAVQNGAVVVLFDGERRFYLAQKPDLDGLLGADVAVRCGDGWYYRLPERIAPRSVLQPRANRSPSRP